MNILTYIIEFFTFFNFFTHILLFGRLIFKDFPFNTIILLNTNLKIKNSSSGVF